MSSAFFQSRSIPNLFPQVFMQGSNISFAFSLASDRYLRTLWTFYYFYLLLFTILSFSFNLSYSSIILLSRFSFSLMSTGRLGKRKSCCSSSKCWASSGRRLVSKKADSVSSDCLIMYFYDRNYMEAKGKKCRIKGIRRCQKNKFFLLAVV